MSKEAFLSSTNAPNSLAEKAWEQSDGDPQRAEELVRPKILWIKGKYLVPGQNYDGLFFIKWNRPEAVANPVKAVVSSDSESIEDVSPTLPHSDFQREFKAIDGSHKKMGGTSNQLRQDLNAAWSNSSSPIRTAVSQDQFSQLESIHGDLIKESLGMDSLNVTLDVEKIREIDEIEDSSPGPSSTDRGDTAVEEEGVVLPSEGEINPVRGIPVNRLQIGDRIFAEVKSFPPEHKNLKPSLEGQRDKETGLIPAKLVTRSSTAAGTIELKVQFGKDVYGKIRCGKDVNLLVPETTRFKRSGDGDFDFSAYLEANWMYFAGGGAFLFVLLIIAILIF